MSESGRRTVSVSLRPEVADALDALSVNENRSSVVSRLIEREAARRGSTPDVRVDGRLFVPARRRG